MWGFQRKKVPIYVRVKSVQENFKYAEKDKKKKETLNKEETSQRAK